MTADQTAIYKSALTEAKAAFERATQRLAENTRESHNLNNDIGKLRRTITALAAMCSEEPVFDKLGITDSCLAVMESEQGTVTSSDVVKLLEQRGFDLASQKNASASVHVVLGRLASKGKILRIENEDKSVTWRGPNYDPDWDAIPF